MSLIATLAAIATIGLSGVPFGEVLGVDEAMKLPPSSVKSTILVRGRLSSGAPHGFIFRPVLCARPCSGLPAGIDFPNGQWNDPSMAAMLRALGERHQAGRELEITLEVRPTYGRRDGVMTEDGLLWVRSFEVVRIVDFDREP